MTTKKYMGRSYAFCLLLTIVLAFAPMMASAQVSVVSAASYVPGVTTDSLATAFGSNFTSETASAEFDDNGNLPLSLGGVSVQVGGVAAPLLFVSPGQVNFLVPETAPLGHVSVRIQGPGGVQTATVAVAAVSPSLFYVDALRGDRGALLNGSTYFLEPFSGFTHLETEEVISTRISLYGTGWRNADQGTVKVHATGAWEGKRELEVEYAGVAPGFAGLDQINVKVPEELRELGLVSMLVEAGGRESNEVSLVLNDALDWKGGFPALYEYLKSSGNQDLALVKPTDVAWARDGSVYIADPAAHSVFRLNPSGVLSRFAGTGSSGNTGDGGAAADATLSEPVAVGVDASGKVYIVDRASNRVRVVGTNGTIEAFAGNGTSGNSGDGGLAIDAALNGPSGITVLPGGLVVIADTHNNRLRVVSTDGRIQNYAGTGTRGDGNVWGDALCAALDGPTSVAAGLDGTVFLVDSGSKQILRVLPNGQITALGGEGEGAECEFCSVADFPLSAESRIATDAAGRLYVAHPQQGRVYVIDSAGVVRHRAGLASGSTEPGNALQTRLSRPLGLAVRGDGGLLVIDSDEARLRYFAETPTETCSKVGHVLFDRNSAVTGETVHAIAYLSCPVSETTPIRLTSSDGALPVPQNLTAPVGADTAHFSFVVGETLETKSVTFSDANHGDAVVARLLVNPVGEKTLASLALHKTSILGGKSTYATLRLGRPAPVGGLTVNLAAAGLTLSSSVQVPAGYSAATFAIHAPSQHVGGDVDVVASAVGETLIATLRVVPGTACVDCACLMDEDAESVLIKSLVLDPTTVGTQTSGTGTVELQAPAPARKARLVIASNHRAVQVPLTMTLSEGETVGTFPISFAAVEETHVVTVSVRSGNTVTATTTLNPVTPSRVNLSSFAVQPTSVTGGVGATGTVTLAAPAPSNGALVEFSSNNAAASMPQRLVIPAGSTSGTVAITTSAVTTAVTATLTATSLNNTTATLQIVPGGAGLGQIGGITISPNPIVSGSNGTGTVTLSSPAPQGGILVNLSSNNPSVTVPQSVVVPSGQTTTTFIVSTIPVVTPQTVTVTGTSANTVTTQLQLLPPGPGEGVIGTLSVTPNPVVSGSSASGTVTLAEEAGPGGVLVNLSSNNPSATVPTSLVIPAGSRVGTFPVTTTPVAATQTAVITATSQNQLTTNLSLQPPAAGNGTIGSLSIAPNPVTTGNAAVGTVTITSPASEGGVLINLSSNNLNASVPASIVIPAGQTSGTFPVTTSPVANNQTATITATSANSVSTDLGLNSPGASLGNLGGVTVAPNPVTSGGNATGTVTLESPAPSNGILVTLASNNPHAAVPPSLVVPSGQTSATFPVTTTAVGAAETATITATSSNAVNTTLNLNPAEPSLGNLANLVINPNPVKSGSATTGTVSLAAPAPVGGVRVTLSSANPNATVPAQLIIAAGQSSGTFTINTTAVASVQSATITAVSANTVTSVLGLNPPDPGTGNIGSLTITPNPVVSGNGATGTVSLTNAAPAGGVLVNLSSDNANAAVPSSVVIPAGQNSATFPVTTSPVASNQTATITAVSANTMTTALTLNSPGAGSGTLQGVVISPNPVTSGSAATGTVTLPTAAPAGGILVTLASNNPVATVPPSIIIPAGQTSGTFPVTTTASGTQQTAVITATSSNAVATTLTLNPPSAGLGNISGLSISPNPAKSGSPATGTVTLAATAPVGGILVNLSSTNANATVPASITIPAGQSSGTFPVTTTAVTTTQTAQITATSANSSMVVLTLNPPDPGLGTISGLSLSPNPVTSGASSTGTVTLGAAAPAGGVRVTLASNNANATVPATLLIPAGSTSGTFIVNTSAVANQQTATITATSANTSTATLTLNAASPESGTLTAFSISPNLVKGGASSTGTVTIGSAAGTMGVLVNLSSNNAHALVPPSITIASGQTVGTFTIQTTAVNALQTATITANSANSRQATLQIDVANPCVESLNLTVNLTNVLTGQGLLNALVTLDGPAPVGGSTINLVGVTGNLGQVFIPQGQTQASVQISVANLLTLVGSTLRAVLGDCPGIQAVISLDIPILGNLTVPASIHIGNNGTGIVSLLEPAPNGGVVVALAATSDTILGNLLNTTVGVNVPTSVTIPEGQLSANFQVQTSVINQIAYALLGDLLGNLNINAQVGVSLTKPIALTKNPTNPNGGQIAAFAVNPLTVKGGVNATGTITLASPAGASGVLVALSSNNASAVVPASITLAAGQTQGTFIIATSSVNLLRTATITATSSNTISRALQVDVADPCVESLNLNVSVTNLLTGQGLLNAAVSLTGPAPVGGSTINLVGVNGNLGQIFVPQGQTSGTVQIAVNNLLTIVGSTLRAVLGSCGAVEVRISLDIPVLGNLTVPASLKLGNSATASVTLLEPAPVGGAVVVLNKDPNNVVGNLLNAIVGITVPATVTVPQGQTSATFQVQSSIVNTLLYNLLGGLLPDLDIVAILNLERQGSIKLTK